MKKYIIILVLVIIVVAIFYSLPFTQPEVVTNDISSEKTEEPTSSWNDEGDISLTPMYGGIEKTEEQKQADKEFVDGIIEMAGGQDKAFEESMKRGWGSYYDADINTAMKRFNQAWLIDSENPDSYFGMGMIEGIKGRLDTSLEVMDIGLEKDPDHDMILCNTAFWYLIKETKNPNPDPDEITRTVENYLERGISANPNNPNCYFIKAHVRTAQGHIIEATKLMLKAISFEEGDESGRVSKDFNLYELVLDKF